MERQNTAQDAQWPVPSMPEVMPDIYKLPSVETTIKARTAITAYIIFDVVINDLNRCQSTSPVEESSPAPLFLIDFAPLRQYTILRANVGLNPNSNS